MGKNNDTAYTSSISCVRNYKVDFQAHHSPSGNCTFLQLYWVFLLIRISIYLTVNFLTRFLKGYFLPTPGVEPGPPGWKPGILTARPYGNHWKGCSLTRIYIICVSLSSAHPQARALRFARACSISAWLRLRELGSAYAVFVSASGRLLKVWPLSPKSAL